MPRPDDALRQRLVTDAPQRTRAFLEHLLDDAAYGGGKRFGFQAESSEAVAKEEKVRQGARQDDARRKR